MRELNNYYHKPELHTTKELLNMQSKGKTLTPDEKKRVLKYEANKRKQNKNK